MKSKPSLLEVRASTVHGTGAFARRALRKGMLIAEYAGHRYPPGHVLEVEADCELTYLFALSDGSTIDGAQGGNATRHLNHSCRPNCEAVEAVDEQGELAVQIMTTRAVAAGAELFIDYALVVDETDDGAYACRCGARGCRGTMAAADRPTAAR